jgi:DNA repair exonuclease SbcCD ATPase subunit
MDFVENCNGNEVLECIYCRCEKAEATIERLKQLKSDWNADVDYWKSETNVALAILTEARTEVEERKDALLDAAKQIDEFNKQRDHWFESAKQENKQFLKTCAEVERLKIELRDTIESYKLNNLQPKTTRPEPSRLEIAALFYSSGFGPVHESLKRADALIAAAKEDKKSKCDFSESDQFQTQIICPHCNSVFQDSLSMCDLSGAPVEYDCEFCDKPFEVVAKIVATFIARKLNQ